MVEKTHSIQSPGTHPSSIGSLSKSKYVIIVSEATYSDAAWEKVAQCLALTHQAEILTFKSTVDEILGDLQRIFPKYACFLAHPLEADRQFVINVNLLTRKVTDTPYVDVIWGILTGYDATNALEIAQQRAPLSVKKVGSGTEIAYEMCDSVIMYSELEENMKVVKEPGKLPIIERGPDPDELASSMAEVLNDFQPDLFITSGHATESEWNIGHLFKAGQLRSHQGQLYGIDNQEQKFPITSPNPKIYLPIGNCLMGHINGPEAMALAFMKSGGVKQMMGYTVPTWYGYGGWGCLDYFLEQPGRFTLAEAFFANQNALLHRLVTYFPELKDASYNEIEEEELEEFDTTRAQTDGLDENDALGLLHDRDVLAFYGDPAWEVRMAEAECAWDQSLTKKDEVYTFEIKPKRGAKTFDPINLNGSKRGGRPIIHLFPKRLKEIKLIKGKNFDPVFSENFLLVPNPTKFEENIEYIIVFEAKTME